MNRSNQHFGVLFVAAFVILIILAIAISSFSQLAKTVSAGEPPTPVPPFTGEAFTAVIDRSLLNQTPIHIQLAAGDWTEVISETFETGIDPTKWTIIDRDLTVNGEYKWGTEDFTPTSTGTSIKSAWAIGDGQEGGALDVTTDGYPANVDSWLIYGPIDMSSVAEATLTFDYWLDSDSGDEFGVAVSTSGTDSANFTGIQTNSGGGGSWASASQNLVAYKGQSSVYIGFKFTSDSTGSSKTGALLDNVQLLVQGGGEIYLPIIKKDPTPTPSPTPEGGTNYRDGFANDIDGWELRRADTQERYDIYHGDDAQGILNVLVKDPEDYIIVSPLVAAPSIPYSLEINAQHKDPENQDLYGIVFGADWDGTTCPNVDFSSCFETYYVLKVEYRNTDGTFLRFKLQKVKSFVSNQPNDVVELIDWTKVSSVDENDFNVWRVEVLENNKIKIYLNNNKVGDATDNSMSSFIQPYFGVIVETKSQHSNARAKFDYFEVVAK